MGTGLPQTLQYKLQYRKAAVVTYAARKAAGQLCASATVSATTTVAAAAAHPGLPCTMLGHCSPVTLLLLVLLLLLLLTPVLLLPVQCRVLLTKICPA
jgi:hypothetical protein